jgi:hypothetical protein
LRGTKQSAFYIISLLMIILQIASSFLLAMTTLF